MLEVFTLSRLIWNRMTEMHSVQTLISTTLVGGSEKFQDKQMFFYNELKKHHNKQSRSEIEVNVTRFDFLNSVCTFDS